MDITCSSKLTVFLKLHIFAPNEGYCLFIINLSVNFVLALLLWGTYLLMILPLFPTKIREILNIFNSFRLYIVDFSFNLNIL